MTCGRGSHHGSVYESTIKPIIDKRCMQCHDGCNPNVPNLSGFDKLAILLRDLHVQILDAETTAIIRDLARLRPDAHVASVLYRAGKRTGRDNTSRHDHDIPVYRPGERAERGELTLIEAAKARGHWRWSLRRECLLHAGRRISSYFYLRRAELGSARQLAPEARIGQLSGRKFGKLLVRVTPESLTRKFMRDCKAFAT
jgi:hypothetical protein